MAAEEGPVVVAAEEARLLALGATGDREPGRAGLSARLVLRLLAEREPEPSEDRRVERREHVALILRRIGGPGDRRSAVALDDTRVVTGREPRGTDPVREREQLVEAEAPVAADARVRRLARRIVTRERLDDGRAELLAEVERDVRDPEAMARLASRDHRRGRAADALARRSVRVDPEAQRHADRALAGREQRDRAVHAAAHRDGGPRRVGRRAHRGPDRVRERIGGERLPAHRRRLEQRQADEVALDPGRVGPDDPLPVDLEPNGGPLAPARGISEELDHAASVASRLPSAAKPAERQGSRRRSDRLRTHPKPPPTLGGRTLGGEV